jgi:hypothetical protein
MFSSKQLRRYFNIAYRPAKADVRYAQANPAEGTTKKFIEAISAVLILYASYSELTEKILKTFALEQSDSASVIGRGLTSLFGVLICLHILFSRSGGTNSVFTYSRVQRIMAHLIIFPVAFSLVMIVWQYFRQPVTTIGTIRSYYELPEKNLCVRENKTGEDSRASRTYLCSLNLPQELKAAQNNIKVSIEPKTSFILTRTSPVSKEGTTIDAGQEPMLQTSGSLRWEWVFQKFDPRIEWKILATVNTNTLQGEFTDEIPLKGTVYSLR